MQAKRHFTNWIVLLLILSCRAAFASPGDSDFRVENGVLAVGPDYKSLDSMSAEARAKALPRIRALIDSPDWETRDAATRALIKVDDGRTMESLLANYHLNGDIYAARYLSSCGGVIIPYLIDDIYDKAGRTVQLSGGWNWREKINMASSRLILSVIERSNQFPVATRTWAKALDSDLAIHLDFILPQVLNQEKQWWEHNRKAIAAKQYGSVTWLPSEKLNLDYKDELKRNPPPPPIPPFVSGARYPTGTQD